MNHCIHLESRVKLGPSQMFTCFSCTDFEGQTGHANLQNLHMIYKRMQQAPVEFSHKNDQHSNYHLCRSMTSSLLTLVK